MRAQNAELVCVYDVNKSVNEQVAQQFQVVASPGLTDLLQSDIDAVYVATPVNMHLEQVVQAAKAGKHVFCEKPLGLNVSEAEQMVEVCRQQGVKFGTAYMMRFVSQHRAALQLIEEGKLGTPVYCRAQLSCWYPPIEGAWRQNPQAGGGGSLADMGSHCLDLLEMFFGEIDQVSCFTRNSVHPYHSEDSAIVSMVFKNGAMGTVDSYFCIPDNSSKNVLELYGSKGSIIAKGTIGQGAAGEMVAYLEDDNAGYDAQQSRNSTNGLVIDPDPVNTYQAEIEEFSSAILDNREPDNNSLIGLHSQKLLAACYHAAATMTTVKVS